VPQFVWTAVWVARLPRPGRWAVQLERSYAGRRQLFLRTSAGGGRSWRSLRCRDQI